MSVGSVRTTPPVSHALSRWPQPWIFLRILAMATSSHLILYWILAIYQQQALAVLPALIIIGSFVIPLAVLMFFLR